MFTMDDLFEIAISMEKNGESVYNQATEKVGQPELKSVLGWMAAEEASHCQWFKNQKKGLDLEIDEVHLKEMVPRVLQDMMGEKALSLEDIDFTEIETISDLLQTFIGFEEDTILFYELIEMFIEDEAVREGLKTIIQEEKGHIEKLTVMKSSLAEEPL